MSSRSEVRSTLGVQSRSVAQLPLSTEGEMVGEGWSSLECFGSDDSGSFTALRGRSSDVARRLRAS